MLLGAGIGGCLAAAGYLLTGEALFFGITAITTAAGILLGRIMDRNLKNRENIEARLSEVVADNSWAEYKRKQQ